MLYLDFAFFNEELLKENEIKFPKIVRKALCFYRKNIGQVFEYNISDKRVIVISKINKRVLKRLDRIFRLDVTKNVCVCEMLFENKEFIKYLKSKDLKIIDGKWILGFMVKDILTYIYNRMGTEPSTQEISMLIKKNDFFIMDTVKRVIKDIKDVNIISDDLKSFKKLEEEEFEEDGAILNITNNFKKATVTSSVVINFDFDEKELNKVQFSKNVIIINLSENMIESQKIQCKAVVDFVNINIPLKYKNIYKKLKNFNSTILYESLIYKKTLYQNIWNEIEKDEVQIISLESNNNIVKIKKIEYAK